VPHDRVPVYGRVAFRSYICFDSINMADSSPQWESLPSSFLERYRRILNGKFKLGLRHEAMP